MRAQLERLPRLLWSWRNAILTSVLLGFIRHFVMVDNMHGIQVYSYDGRVLSNPRFPGLRVQFLNKKTLSLSPDAVAIVGRSESKSNSGADSKGKLRATLLSPTTSLTGLCAWQWCAFSTHTQAAP